MRREHPELAVAEELDMSIHEVERPSKDHDEDYYD